MEIYNKNAITDSLKKYDFTSVDNSFIEISEWKNGEGIDIFIDNYTQKFISLSYGELEAINFLAKQLEYKDK